MKRPAFTKARWWQAPFCTLAFACSSTGVGSPGAASLSLAIVSDDSEPSVTGEPAALEPLPERALETALIVLGSLRWLPCADAGDEALGYRDTGSVFLVDWSSSVAVGPGVLSLGVSNLFNRKYVNATNQASGDFFYYLSEGTRATLGYSVRF